MGLLPHFFSLTARHRRSRHLLLQLTQHTILACSKQCKQILSAAQGLNSGEVHLHRYSPVAWQRRIVHAKKRLLSEQDHLHGGWPIRHREQLAGNLLHEHPAHM